MPRYASPPELELEPSSRLFAIAEELRLEGIVAIHGGSPYRRGKASGWLEVKTTTGQEIDEERAKWNER